MSRKSDDESVADAGPGTDTDARWRQVAQRHYDPDGAVELTTALVFAVAEGRGVDPTELRDPPLYECVDAAALEETFFGSEEASRRGVGTVEFRYADLLVTIDSDGWIRIYEPTEGAPP
jgi:hypothetical protein